MTQIEVKQFWMVYVEGLGAPNVKHDTLLSAQREAERFLRENEQRVFVLEARMFCERELSPISWFQTIPPKGG